MGTPLHRNTVSGVYVQLLYEYVEARGLAPEDVLGAAWPSSDPATGGVDDELWETLLERASVGLNDPLLGLHLGRTINARHLGILGAVLQACDCAGEALLRFERYQRLIYDVAPLVRRQGENWVDIGWDVNQHLSGPLVEQTGYTVLVQFVRELVRGEADPLLVRFAHPPPPDPKPLFEWLNCPVEFEAPEPALRFSLDLLKQPLKSPDPALIELLEQHADRLMAKLPQQEKVVEQVRKAIAHALRNGEPQIEAIAAELHCSARTLQRRLGKANTSFRDERNLVRKELALSYLADPHLQILDIALLLGYSEHSSFTRAFREWCGRTPQQVREQDGVVVNSKNELENRDRFI